ncbi:CheR family methyltransferase [Cystobacter fuscus]
MTDAECRELLRWAAPRLGLREEGFRRVRAQVCKRVGRRMKALGLSGLDAYVARLEAEPAERAVLDALCRVTISRFYRDSALFDALLEPLLPQVLVSARARGECRLRVWSAGCASGEEPYSVSVLFRRGLAPRFPDFHLELVATDADASLLERARRGCYRRATLRELPAAWRHEPSPRSGTRTVCGPSTARASTSAGRTCASTCPRAPSTWCSAATWPSPTSRPRAAGGVGAAAHAARPRGPARARRPRVPPRAGAGTHAGRRAGAAPVPLGGTVST